MLTFGLIGASQPTYILAESLAYFNGTTYVDDDGNLRLDSLVGSDQAEVKKAQSEYYTGTQYGAYASLVGHPMLAKNIPIFYTEFYTSVAIDASTTGMQLIQLDDTADDAGIILGSHDAGLTNEIITITDGTNSCYWADAAATIAIGAHTLLISYDGDQYQITLDGVAKTTDTEGTPALLKFDRFRIGDNNALSAPLDNFYRWNTKLTDSEGNYFWIPGCHPAATRTEIQGVVVETDGTVTPWGGVASGTVDPAVFFHESQDGLTGISPNWPGYSARTDLGATFPVSGTQVAIPDLPNTDIAGGVTQYRNVKRNPEIKGYTADLNGTTYGVLASPVTLVGNFEIKAPINLTNTTGGHGVFGGAGTTECFFYAQNSTGYPGIYIDNTAYTFEGVTIAVETYYLLVFTRVGTSGTVTLTENDTGVVQTQSKTVKTNDIIIRELGSYKSGTSAWEGSIPYIKLYNSAGTCINDWVIQSRKGATQAKWYDRVGGNHATITGTFDPDMYNTTFAGRPVLAEYGFREVRNLLLQSEDLTATWSNTRSTDTTGEILCDATADTTHFMSQVISGLADNTDYVVRAKLKKKDFSWCRVAVISKDASAVQGFYDLNNGAVGTGTDITISAPDSDGYYLCSLPFNSLSGATTPTVLIYIAEANGDYTLAGTVTGQGIYAKEMQVAKAGEAYIKTTTAAILLTYIPASASDPTVDCSTGAALTAAPRTIAALEGGSLLVPQDKDLLNADIVGQDANEPINWAFDPDGDQIRLRYPDDFLPQYSADLGTNMDFSSGDLTGWTNATTGGGSAVVTDYKAVISSGATYATDRGQITQEMTGLTSGNYCELIIKNSSDYNGTLGAIFAHGSQTIPANSTTVYKLLSNATSGIIKLYSPAVNSVSAVYDNIRFREITSTGADINDQDYVGTKALVLYDSPTTSAESTRIKRQIGAS